MRYLHNRAENAAARLHVNHSHTSDTLPDAPADLPLALGVGCRSGVTLAQIEAAVQAALSGRTFAQVKVVATLDAKAAEPALLAFCAAHALPLRAFTREQVAALETALETDAMQSAPSAAAQVRFGVAGVCEPCARLAANGGALVRAKIALDGVTVALAAIPNSTTQTAKQD
ncbi:cobalamin biosynthesis protein CbiG [Burkholderia sp. Ax-1719]|nr:cobalamin biosynthesis protein CbiG [Burkholderia sp. Ax-1719]